MSDLNEHAESDDPQRERFLSGDLRPGFCRAGWGCRYCPRPHCNWERRQQHLPDVRHGDQS